MQLQNVVTYMAEWAKAQPKKAAIIAGFLILFLLLDGRAWGQAVKWNEDVVSWNAPTQCTDGSPIGDCPITGYRLETAATPTATAWTLVTTTAANVLSFKLTGLTSGQHCYRVIALSGSKSSNPSNVACDTAEGPAPGTPTLRTVDTVAYNIKFDWRRWRYVADRPVGTVAIGTACSADFSVRGGYYRIDPKAVTFTRRAGSPVIVAKCG